MTCHLEGPVLNHEQSKDDLETKGKSIRSVSDTSDVVVLSSIEIYDTNGPVEAGIRGPCRRHGLSKDTYQTAVEVGEHSRV